MLHAHFINMANPGSYEKELNMMLKLNNLPEIKAPQNPPSAKILIRVEEAEDRRTEAEEESEAQAEDQTNKENESAEEEKAGLSADSNKREIKGKKKKQIKGCDIGLMLYTPTSVGWPKDTDKK